jgi:hypothetical protein
VQSQGSGHVNIVVLGLSVHINFDWLKRSDVEERRGGSESDTMRSMSRTTGVSVLTAFLCVFAAADRAWACTCSPAPVFTAYGRADEVFTARVITVRQDPASDIQRLIARVRVSESLKGTASGEFEVFPVPLCAFPFERGGDYLIYAHFEPEGLTTELCNGTKSLDRAGADLSYFKGVSEGRSGAVVYGRIATERQTRDGTVPSVRLVLSGSNGQFETVVSGRQFEFHFVPSGIYHLSAIDAEVVSIVTRNHPAHRVLDSIVVPEHMDLQPLIVTVRTKE